MENFNREYMYNPGTDLIVNWGQHLLERKCNCPIENEDLEGQLASWNQNDLGVDLVRGLIKIMKNANLAKGFLDNNPIIPISGKIETHKKAVKAIGTFDEVLFLLIGSNNVFGKTETSKKIEGVYATISEWLDMRFLRLVPLNKWRQFRLTQIPSHNRYMYPWWEGLSDLNPNTLQDLGSSKISNLIWDYLRLDLGLQAALKT